MKNGLRDIVGKQIAGVVAAKNNRRPPHNQVFLVFSDGTRFELYGNFSCCSGLDRADGIDRYVLSAGGEVERVYGDVAAESLEPRSPLTTGPTTVRYETSGSEDLEQLMSRDLKAWQEAKAAIERAKWRR